MKPTPFEIDLARQRGQFRARMGASRAVVVDPPGVDLAACQVTTALASPVDVQTSGRQTWAEQARVTKTELAATLALHVGAVRMV
jgi:hypothetical protein